MSLLRTVSTARLLALLAGLLAVVAGGTAIAVAASGGGTPPPPQPLASAVHDALTASAPDGLTARVQFTNNLLPSSALTGVSSPLLSGASGRLWVTNDGRGRIELQSDAGDVQVVWSQTKLTVYDASSNTVYELALPAHATTPDRQGRPPTIDQISAFLSRLADYANVSGAMPGVVAGQGSYSVSVSPKENGGLVDSVALAWYAAHGVPLELAVYAKGSSAPALELVATDISFGPVADADVDVPPPAGAKVVDLRLPTGGSEQQKPEVTGLAAVQAAVPFQVVAPDSLAGRARDEVRLVGSKNVVVTYGKGLGTIVVVERAAEGQQPGGGLLGNLPTVEVNGVAAHELATELGTVLDWQQGGVSFALAGSVAAGDAEAAAAALA